MVDKPKRLGNTVPVSKQVSAAAATLGRIGGKATSRCKVLAARRNGKKGGRPKQGDTRRPTGDRE